MPGLANITLAVGTRQGLEEHVSNCTILLGHRLGRDGADPLPPWRER